MNWAYVMCVLAGLGVWLIVLWLWECRIRHHQRTRHLADWEESKQVGTHLPIAQHPQIDPYLCIGCGCCVRSCPEKALSLVNHTAHLSRASHCVGHAYCEQVCPMGAIRVGLGDLAHTPDMPVLSDTLETSIPGVFIVGELGGMALIRHGINQGTAAVDHIARTLQQRKETKSPDVLDILIVGAGPSGIAATLRARQLGLHAVTIDRYAWGGAVRRYPRAKLTMTRPVTLPLHGRLKRTQYTKEELLDLWASVFEQHNIRIHDQEALLAIEPDSKGLFQCQTSVGVHQARTVILALGRRSTPRQLGVPGEDLPHVLYDLDDPAVYRDEDLLVVGGGDSAVETALALAEQPNTRVTLAYRRAHFFRVKRQNLDALNDLISQNRLKVLYHAHVTTIAPGQVTLEIKPPSESSSTEHIPAQHIFIRAGGTAPYGFLKDMGIRFGTHV